jgi:uncharacterized protein YggE
MTTLHRNLLLVGALLAAGATAASAQAGAASRDGIEPAHVITVVGRGQVGVPPDRVRVILRFFPRNGPGGTSAPAYDEAARDLVDAIKRAGAADARVSIPLEASSGPNVQPAVVAMVRKPTRDTIEKMARDTIANLPASVAPAFANYQLTTTLLLDDCSEPETRAQNAALADAHARAERVAAAAGVKLGAVVAVNEGASFGVDPCRAATQFSPVQNGLVDPYGPLEVPVSVSAIVTYAIL